MFKGVKNTTSKSLETLHQEQWYTEERLDMDRITYPQVYLGVPQREDLAFL